MEWIDRARARLALPVDGASLVVYRALFGLMVAWECCRYYSKGWIQKYFVDPEVTFPYLPFTFVQPWPVGWMNYAHVATVGLAALAVAAGLRYRVASVVLWVGFTWMFLIDQTRYLNHFYLISLLSFLGIFLPLHRLGSLDAWSGRVETSQTQPTWALWLVRFMVGVPYFYGGIAKLSSDWLDGFPMVNWLAKAGDHPFAGIGGMHETDLALAVFVWGGLFFDLLIVPALLWQRTRVFALGFMLLFHFSNAWMFGIGVFPWMMIGLTLVMLPPDWPRQVVADVREARPQALALAVGALAGFTVATSLSEEPSPVEAVVAALGVGIFAWELLGYGWDRNRPAPAAEPAEVEPIGRAAFAGLAAFALLQLLLPFRHWTIPGDVHWTEEGHRWSWHMLLRDKIVEEFVYVVDPPGDAPPFEVQPKDHLLKHQLRKVAYHPEMNVNFGKWLAEKYGGPGTAVYVRSSIGLNGRRGAPLIAPDQDLTKLEIPWWGGAEWIVPLEEELPLTAQRSAPDED